MYKKILVPLDGSKRAEMILPYVEDLAGRYQATIIFLMSLEYTFTTGIEGAFIELTEKDFNRKQDEVKSYLKKIADKFIEKKINAETRIAFGPAVGAILETASKDNVDLIAMTSHGGGALSRVFYGSVASGVLNRVDRPLLVIRTRKA
ncbi:MAG: universal stress protein [Desulfobacterales bacterium]|jgi:nucleotide-binding universal stress UspA family protein